MHRAQEGRGLGGEQPEGQVVQVEVQDVELVGALVDLLQHAEDRRQRVADLRVQAGRPRPHGHQPRRGDRIAAGEQGHVVAERDQFLGQVGHHPLGAAVALRRHRLGQRGDLCDAHPFHSPLRAHGSNGSVSAGRKRGPRRFGSKRGRSRNMGPLLRLPDRGEARPARSHPKGRATLAAAAATPDPWERRMPQEGRRAARWPAAARGSEQLIAGSAVPIRTRYGPCGHLRPMRRDVQAPSAAPFPPRPSCIPRPSSACCWPTRSPTLRRTETETRTQPARKSKEPVKLPDGRPITTMRDLLMFAGVAARRIWTSGGSTWTSL